MIPVPDGEVGKAIAEKYFPQERWEEEYRVSTAVLRRVGKFSGLNINEVLDLPYSFFMLLNRDSWIDSFMRNETGRELLKTLWTLQQTSADIEAIRSMKGGAFTWQRA